MKPYGEGLLQDRVDRSGFWGTFHFGPFMNNLFNFKYRSSWP